MFAPLFPIFFFCGRNTLQPSGVKSWRKRTARACARKRDRKNEAGRRETRETRGKVAREGNVEIGLQHEGI